MSYGSDLSATKYKVINVASLQENVVLCRQSQVFKSFCSPKTHPIFPNLKYNEENVWNAAFCVSLAYYCT